jgi:glycosyltransferase involved in cell wall biosynthesis
MRVLQIIQKPQLRGAEIFACQLSTELLKAGHHVDVVYLFSVENFALDFKLNFITLDAKFKNRFLDLGAFKRLAHIISEGRYDIVQANAGDTLKYAVLSRIIHRWKAKLIFRNANKMSGFIGSLPKLIFNKWLLSNCDFFISVSENSRRDLISIMQAAATKSVAIPIGAYDVTSTPEVIRDISVTGPILIAVGSFVPEKNHLFLLDVFRSFYQKMHTGCLWIVGDGQLRGQLEQKIDEYHLKERVVLWGYRKDIISILRSADVFIMPSLIEGLPAVILEAISCEVPVIASGVGGIPEIIENDVTGICVADWSAELYVEKILYVLDHQDYRSKLVRGAKSKFLQQFTVEKVSEDFIRCYKSCLTIADQSQT